MSASTQAAEILPQDDASDGASPDIVALVRRVDDTATALRASSGLGPASKDRTKAWTRSMHDRWHTLEARRQEIAGLQQMNEMNLALERARREIGGLEDTEKLLRARIAQQKKEAAAAQQAQARLEAENAALRAEREQANTNFVDLLRQTAELRTAFEAREKEMAAMRTRVTALKQELAVKRAGGADLAAAIEEARARYYRDFDKLNAQFEAETGKLARALGAHQERVRTLKEENVQLAARCDGLARNAANFEATTRAAREQLESQAAKVDFLDAALQAERADNGRRIAALTVDLQCERMSRTAEAQKAAMVRREIGKLLPRLAQVSEPREPEMDAAANDATTPLARTAAS